MFIVIIQSKPGSENYISFTFLLAHNFTAKCCTAVPWKLKGRDTELLAQATKCRGIRKLVAEHILEGSCLVIMSLISLLPNFIGRSGQFTEGFFGILAYEFLEN